MKNPKIPPSIKNQPSIIYIVLTIVYLLQTTLLKVDQFFYLSVHFGDAAFFNYIYFLYHENWLHLINNLIILFVFTCMANLKPMQSYVTKRDLITLFIATSLITGVIFQITYYFGLHQQTEFLIGASGGVYAIVGLSVSRVLLSVKKLTQGKYMALFLVVIVFLYDQVQVDWLTAENGSIYVHFGGFVIGAVYGVSKRKTK